MKLLRYHLHCSQWHPWVCLDLLAQFPNSAWGFLSPICPKEHLMCFYHHYQWPVVKYMNIYWFQILFWNHGQVIKSCDDALSQAEHWGCSMLCPLWTVFISCVQHVPLIMEAWVHMVDIVRYYYYLRSWTKDLGRVMQYTYFSVILGSLIKQSILFETKFCCSSPSHHPIQSWNLEKNSGYMHPTLFVG